MSDLQVSVERTIEAPPQAIFAVLADAARHRDIDGSGSVKGPRQSAEPLRAGSVFGMSMKKGLPYSTRNTVVEFEPDRRIAWQTQALAGLIGGRIWRYELEPVENGTRVRETWDLRRDRQRFLLRRGSMPRTTRDAMTRTLERLANLVEA